MNQWCKNYTKKRAIWGINTDTQQAQILKDHRAAHYIIISLVYGCTDLMLNIGEDCGLKCFIGLVLEQIWHIIHVLYTLIIYSINWLIETQSLQMITGQIFS